MSKEFDELKKTIARLRAEDGCPWDRAQTMESLKPECIEEAAEVICGIDILKRSGNPENLKEELGDLLLQVMMLSQIAEEQGLFSVEEVCRGINDKMIRRHPHVFGQVLKDENGNPVTSWEGIKRLEKAGKEWMDDYLPASFEEAKQLILAAERRKGMKQKQYMKLEIFIPETHLRVLQKALQEVDAGHIGDYDSCLSYSPVMGTWRPLDGTNPYIGKTMEISEEPELKVEVTIEAEKLEKTVAAIKAVHPYEEPVINGILLAATGLDQTKIS